MAGGSKAATFNSRDVDFDHFWTLNGFLERVFCAFIPLLCLIAVLVTYILAIGLDIANYGERFETRLEFTALLYLTVPASLIFLSFGFFLYLSCVCSHMDRGCVVSPLTRSFHNPGKELSRKFWRRIEWLDFGSDLVGVFLIYQDFNTEWRAVLIASLVITFLLNLYGLFVISKDDHSWIARRRKLALSFALLGSEDIIMVPVGILYLNEEVISGQLTPLQAEVERIAVGMSTAIGAVLLLIRFSGLIYHICCSLPDLDEELLAALAIDTDKNDALKKNIVDQVGSPTTPSLPIAIEITKSAKNRQDAIDDDFNMPTTFNRDKDRLSF